MSGEGVIPAAPTGGSAVETDAAWLGLDARAVRHEALKLALVGNESSPVELVIARATVFVHFVLEGNGVRPNDVTRRSTPSRTLGQ
jgi:hypothetical protein